MEARASDQWNLYQAKKIRQDNLAVVVETLALNTPSTPAIQQKIADFKTRIAKWTHDLEEEQGQSPRVRSRGVRCRAPRQPLRSWRSAAADRRRPLLRHPSSRATAPTFVFGLSLGVIGLIIAATALTVH